MSMDLYVDHIISDRCCPDCSDPMGEFVNLYYKDGEYICPKCERSTTSPDDDLCFKDGTRYALAVNEAGCYDAGLVHAFSYHDSSCLNDYEYVMNIDFETFAAIAVRGCKVNYGDIINLN